jgi:hypothetical protein
MEFDHCWVRKGCGSSLDVVTTDVAEIPGFFRYLKNDLPVL